MRYKLYPLYIGFIVGRCVLALLVVCVGLFGFVRVSVVVVVLLLFVDSQLSLKYNHKGMNSRAVINNNKESTAIVESAI